MIPSWEVWHSISNPSFNPISVGTEISFNKEIKPVNCGVVGHLKEGKNYWVFDGNHRFIFTFVSAFDI